LSSEQLTTVKKIQFIHTDRKSTFLMLF